MLLKWGAGFLTASRPEWLPAETPDGLLWQLPAQVEPSRLAHSGGPLVASGRADRIDPAVLSAAGLSLTERDQPDGYRLGAPTSDDLAAEERVHLPERREVVPQPDTWIGYASDGAPLLAGRNGVYHWQPPDLADPGNPLVPHSQIGSVNPYVEAARLINDRAAATGGFSVEQMAAHEPVTVGCWRSGGRIHLLLGNLESGWMGDSRFARRATVHLPRERFGLRRESSYRAVRINGDAPALSADPGGPPDMVSFTIEVPPQGCVVLRIEDAT
jgi:hypothetical protein